MRQLIGTTSLFSIWVVELESTLLDAVVIIDSCSVQEQIAFLVDYNLDAVLHGGVVFSLIEVTSDVQTIVEA